MKIAIWGNAGSGKSTFAIKLANSLVRMQKNVLLIDSNFAAPQANIWFPDMQIKRSESISELLKNAVTAETLSSKIHIVKDDLLGVLGYAKEYAVACIPKSDTTVKELYACADSLADVVITDCQSSFYPDLLSFHAVSSADILIVVLTADNRGLSWYDANVPNVLSELQNNSRRVIRMFGQAEEKDPIADVEKYIETVHYVLPYSAAIHMEMATGTMAQDNHRSTAKEYTKIVDTIARDIMSTESVLEEEKRREALQRNTETEETN